jgi:hypothetical protein
MSNKGNSQKRRRVMEHFLKYLFLSVFEIGFSAIGYAAEPADSAAPEVIDRPCPRGGEEVYPQAPEERIEESKKIEEVK